MKPLFAIFVLMIVGINAVSRDTITSYRIPDSHYDKTVPSYVFKTCKIYCNNNYKCIDKCVDNYLDDGILPKI